MEAWTDYRRRMAAGDYFGAHEVLEGMWRQDHAPGWQLAIWWAALYVHWSRRHWPGALKLARKIEQKTGNAPRLDAIFRHPLHTVAERIGRQEELAPDRDLLPYLDRIIVGLREETFPTIE